VVEASTRRGRGTGWIVFAGILMILAGANMAINGLWALHAPDAVVKSFSDSKVLLFSSGDLDTWGWIYLIVGAVVIVAGIMVFSGSRSGSGSVSRPPSCRPSSRSSGSSRLTGLPLS
jgi:uncharacterized membrane protein HdeD (DUF308 family)